MKVYDIGTVVTIGPKDDGTKGIVAAILISNGTRVQYKIAWWDGRTRHEEWLEAFEIVGKASDRCTIGFLPSKA